MKTAVISFSRNGSRLGELICQKLKEQSHDAKSYCKSKYKEDGGASITVGESVQDWTEKRFADSDAIVFVGACGIAVRSIAPYVRSKKQDPAVIVADEQGKFVISLLSGHLGGANELAEQIAGLIHAQPVVTTATDLNQKFAVDIFAKKNHCLMIDLYLAKEVSAALLAEKEIGFASDFPWIGNIPSGLKLFEEGKKQPELGIYVTSGFQRQPFARTLYLIPRVITIGVGCKRNTPKHLIEKLVCSICEDLMIPSAALEQVASIDLKKDEAGLIDYCRERNLPFVTYPAEELRKLEGNFSASGFVAEITGVDNVCERAALLASSSCAGEGRLILKKHTQDGVTAALAVKEWSVRFE